MSIWFKKYSTEDMNQFAKNSMTDYIGIEIGEVGEDYLKARMPVDHRTKQPLGIMHGGASLVLAETLGSVASYMTVDPAKKRCVGLEINANHIRPMFEGYVEGTARPVHLGKTTQIWEIKIYSPEGKMVCISRITMALLDKQ